MFFSRHENKLLGKNAGVTAINTKGKRDSDIAPPKNLGDSGESGVASEGCRGERRKGQNADEMEKLEGTFFGSGPK